MSTYQVFMVVGAIILAVGIILVIHGKKNGN